MTFSSFSWACTPNLIPWWHSWIQSAPSSNTHSPIPNKLSLSWTKLYRKPTDYITLLHFHSHHQFSCKEGIIYSQALRYNMIISEDHILQELKSLTPILLARVYPLHLIIKNISLDPQPQLPVIPTNTTYRNQHSPHCNSLLIHWQTTHNHHTQKLAHSWRWHHTLHHLAIQTFISLYQILQYS